MSSISRLICTEICNMHVLNYGYIIIFISLFFQTNNMTVGKIIKCGLTFVEPFNLCSSNRKISLTNCKINL